MVIERSRRRAAPSACALAALSGVALAGAALISGAFAGDPSADRAAIAQLIKSTWETADKPIVIDPVVVTGEHGLAGWIQGERGGRALLRRENGVWSVVLCSGDPLREPHVLVEAGVPAAIAGSLAAELRDAERRLVPEHLSAMSKFEGLVDLRSQPHGHGHHK